MTESYLEKLNNIMRFVECTIIVGGFGYDYRKAIRMLYEGYDFYYVLSWYNNQIGLED